MWSYLYFGGRQIERRGQVLRRPGAKEEEVVAESM